MLTLHFLSFLQYIWSIYIFTYIPKLFYIKYTEMTQRYFYRNNLLHNIYNTLTSSIQPIQSLLISTNTCTYTYSIKYLFCNKFVGNLINFFNFINFFPFLFTTNSYFLLLFIYKRLFF